MNDDEQQKRLENLLSRGGWVEPLESPDLGQVAAESTRRRRRRRAVMSSAFTVLVVGASVGVAQAIANSGSEHGRDTSPPAAQSTSTAPGDVVAWVANKPVTPPTPAACAKGNLTFTLGRRGAYQGQASLQIDVRNTSASPCTIPGDIAVSAVGAASGSVKVSNDQSSGIVTLRPQESLSIMIGTPTTGCGASADYATGLLVSVGSVTGPVLSNAQVRVDCGTPNVIQTFVDKGDPATEALTVSASIDAPATVSAGSTLKFNVTLTNESAAAVKFDQCPNYTEGLKNSQVSEAYQLNCTTAPDIPAGGSVTFAMELAVPSGTAASDDLLAWSLTGYPAIADAPITVK